MTASHNIVVIGGGGAGLRAAIAIAETNPRLSVAIVSKVYPMRSHTVSVEGGAAAVAGEDDSLDEHAYDTVSGSDWLCDQDAVEAFVNPVLDGTASKTFRPLHRPAIAVQRAEDLCDVSPGSWWF